MPRRSLLLTILGLVVALCVGMWLGGHPEALPGPLRTVFVAEDRAIRAEVIDTIEDNFHRRVERERLEGRSPDEMVRLLDDRYSHYFSPSEAVQFEQGVSGQFEGVGMSVAEDRRGLRVLEVFEGSPAGQAGIRAGDVIVAVDGRSIAGQSSEEATTKIKGPPGTSVRLTAVRGGQGGRRRTVTVRRARIEVPVASGELVEEDGEKIGVATLETFSSGAHGALRAEIDELLRAGAEGIVLDLRGNGGGLLDEAVLVSSIFVEDGLIVSTEGRKKARREFRAQGDAIDEDVPVAVLVNGGSASASEIVTGALRDTRRAVVVGTRTFGKGVFQEVATLSNGGALDLTVGSYFLPSGENISDKGIAPQVPARDDPDTARDEALPVALDALAERIP